MKSAAFTGDGTERQRACKLFSSASETSERSSSSPRLRQAGWDEMTQVEGDRAIGRQQSRNGDEKARLPPQLALLACPGAPGLCAILRLFEGSRFRCHRFVATT